MESPNSGFRFWQIIISLPCSGSLSFFSLIHSVLFLIFRLSLYLSICLISTNLLVYLFLLCHMQLCILFPLSYFHFILPCSSLFHFLSTHITLSPQSVLPSPSTHVFPLLTSLSSSFNNFPLFLLPPVPFSLSFYTRTLSHPLPS